MFCTISGDIDAFPLVKCEDTRVSYPRLIQNNWRHSWKIHRIWFVEYFVMKSTFFSTLFFACLSCSCSLHPSMHRLSIRVFCCLLLRFLSRFYNFINFNLIYLFDKISWILTPKLLSWPELTIFYWKYPLLNSLCTSSAFSKSWEYFIIHSLCPNHSQTTFVVSRRLKGIALRIVGS